MKIQITTLVNDVPELRAHIDTHQLKIDIAAAIHELIRERVSLLNMPDSTITIEE